MIRPFEGLVAAGVSDPARRRLQARAIAGLVGAGLLAALLTPLAMLAGLGLAATLGFSLIAAISLAGAAALALSGEFELVAAALYTVAAALVGVLCVSIDSLWPAALLLVGLAEARLAGCGLLFRLMLPSVFAAFGLVGFLSLHGMGPAGQGLAGGWVALPVLALYGAIAAWRLRRSRARAAEALPTPFLRLDAEGTILPPAGRMPALGAQGEAQRFSQRLHLLDRVAFLKAMDEIRLGSGPFDLDLRVEDDEGFAAMALRLVPVRRNDGSLANVDLVDLSSTEPMPMASARAEAIGLPTDSPALLATVSHELRTPLNAIIGFSDLLDQEVFGAFADPRQKEYVGLIRRSSQHLLDVVNGLLDVSKLEAGRYELAPKPFSITEMAQCAAEMIRGEADAKGLRFLVKLAPLDDTIVADRRACQQILVNLLANAVKFTHEGTVCLSVRTQDGALVFEVTDTGIGIGAEDIDRLGRPFVQLSQGLARRYEGTGLGLSLVKGLAELHHGSLRIKSQPGRGTVVTVRIPTNCAERILAGGTPSENVVALTHARKKDSLLPQADPDRRTA
ncbi:HAMP domain-containing sensor histidine kinase [Aureimonas sp. AU12]|uniref:sensor histidine kinase n=1 Tax=Aureimonas sp. AU12 TaxID=1638161 RepID=UPI00078453BC|nr:HAMP domain-containing sensor histidine kinase [Aureimonas sp. AU12]